jgi:hypothetical protein
MEYGVHALVSVAVYWFFFCFLLEDPLSYDGYGGIPDGSFFAWSQVIIVS